MLLRWWNAVKPSFLTEFQGSESVNTMAIPQSILLLDDDRQIHELVMTVADGLEIPCTATTDPKVFLDLLSADTGMILLDLIMPGTDGIEVMRLLGDRHSSTPIVILSGIGQRIIEAAEDLAAALGLILVGHLQKPFRIDDLESLLLHSLPDDKAPTDPVRHTTPISDHEILTALDRSQFVLHYQPQIEIKTGATIGIEALVRWAHPSGDLIEPDSFIPRIEKLERMEQLAWIVSRGATDDMKEIQNKTHADISLSINISVHSLHDLNFPEKFIALMESRGLFDQTIVLEITESGLVGQLASTLDVLTRLRMKNVDLSIDDFGTGYSMMQQLRHIPATEIKIDRGFVQKIQNSQGDRVVVQKTIEIGHDLNMIVVAEGVETASQLEFLAKHGCDRAQGYLFGRPMPKASLLQWMQSDIRKLPDTRCVRLRL